MNKENLKMYNIIPIKKNILKSNYKKKHFLKMIIKIKKKFKMPPNKKIKK